jgi:ATP-dependent helicase HrpB
VIAPGSTPLPIDQVLAQLVRELQQTSNLVLVAPPGAGKSTRVPPVLQQSLGSQLPSRWIVLQPRRVAAAAVASRIASEWNWQLGREVGYHVRFDKRYSRDTQLVCMTDGLFLRQLQQNPWLEGIAGVILDEFHERSLNLDLILALCRRVQSELRPDLRLIVMSATLQAEPVAAYLQQAPVIHSEGRTFPVEVRHQRFADSRPLVDQVTAAVSELWPNTSGDLLVFLPGVGEIRQCSQALANQPLLRDALVEQLYGELPLAAQQRVLAPSSTRKIILSTNVAETSLTIPGVTAVIDSGLARVMRFDPLSGINRLQLERISQASATQRAGRAGRTQPGVCQRLWTENDQRVMSVADTPEIQRVDLTSAVLELLNWGETDLEHFPWYEAPTSLALQTALSQLTEWGAITRERKLTVLGQRMNALPLQPRLARLVLAGEVVGVAPTAALMAAILSERDPLRDANSRRQSARHHSDSDLLDRVTALEEFTATKRADTWLGRLDHGAAKTILRVAEQIESDLERSGDDLAEELDTDEWNDDNSTEVPALSSFAQVEQSASESELLRRCLLLAYPDRVVRRREATSPRGLMVGGRGVKLVPGSAVRDAEFFLAIELQESSTNEAAVSSATAIDPSWLDPALITTQTEVEYDAERDRVIARQRKRYLDLLLQETATSVPSAHQTQVARLLAREALARWEQLFPSDAPLSQFLSRWQCLCDWLPDANLPRFDQAFLEQLIEEQGSRCLSLAELQKRPWLDAIRQQFDYQQWQLLEREAPEKLAVPSGSRITLEYSRNKSPVLAVRIQELFGLPATPRIAQGRVPVLLHLLGPNFRPQQVTEDLASFWKNTYPEVKKELKRRYPKHSWPDDPLTAPPQNKGGRRA